MNEIQQEHLMKAQTTKQEAESGYMGYFWEKVNITKHTRAHTLDDAL